MQIYNTILQTGVLQGYNLLVLDFGNMQLNRLKINYLKAEILKQLQQECCQKFLIKLAQRNFADNSICKVLEAINNFDYPLIIEISFTNTANLATILPYAQTLIVKLAINNREFFLNQQLEYKRLLLLLEIRNSYLEIDLNLIVKPQEEELFFSFLKNCQSKVHTVIYVQDYNLEVKSLIKAFPEIRFLRREV